VTLNPATPLVELEEVLPIVGQVLVMSVNPGFGGQTFIPMTLDKIARLRAMIDARNPRCRLEVDGGIKASNIGKVVAAGADTIVAGSAIFGPDATVAEAVEQLRSALGPAGGRG
jgi:ribulose-phosphate 3-epimerase